VQRLEKVSKTKIRKKGTGGLTAGIKKKEIEGERMKSQGF
jgi:hypothetical protein